MALDVHLTREENECWGFELVGGADFEMPLTIQKIKPGSPAKRAGLQNGDTVLMINGEEAIDLGLEAASRSVAECGTVLTIGVMRGLYDPVLDDQEPIYDYEPEDLDQQSEPTEVPFKVQQFIDPSDLGSHPLDYDTPFLGSTPLPGTTPLTESRSLTASPFVAPIKPYRPFSTEPLIEVPPLEDPIILNPNYKDEFGKSPADVDPDYLLNAHYKDELAGFEGKYKLPISEQYDPDGTRFVQTAEVVDKLLKYEKHIKSLSKDVQVVDVTKETKISETVTKDVKESLVTDVKSKETLSKDATIEDSLKDVKIEKKDVKFSEEISNHEESIRTETQITEKKEMFKEDVEEKTLQEELKYIEKMKQEIDLEKIEETALLVVDDSIERAVTVAEEIKKEIEEESISSKTEQKSQSEKLETSQESTKIINDTEMIEAKPEAKSHEIEMTTESESESSERKISRHERTEVFDVKESEISEKDGQADVERKSFISQEYEHEDIVKKPRRKESVDAETKTFEGNFQNQGEFKKVTKTVITAPISDKNGAEQRAYTIGLQTIPNIRGVVHSSYHYDLLLRTFFIHLTDVMVALSRFVLTQPIFNELASKQETVTETCESRARNADVRKSSQVTETSKKVERQTAEEAKMKVVETKQEVSKPVKVTQQELKVVSGKVEEKKVEQKEMIKNVPVRDLKQEIKIDKKDVKQEIKVDKKDIKEVEVQKVVATRDQKLENMTEVKQVTEVTEKKAVTGAQMAQRSEKKLSQELTQKMDAVISEFQTVAVEDVKKEILQRNRRSRSRSQVEEEVMKESDPLEWLAKVDSRRTSQERTDTSKKELSSIETMEMEKRSKTETRHETKYKTPKSPKQTYIAIVESHVYTNKDVIFEEHVTDFSETSSVQSAEEINTAFESLEAMSTENVVLENAIKKLETAKIVEESHELATVTAKSAETVQNIEEVMHDSKEIIQEEYKKETAIQSSDIQEILIQETKQIIEPVVDIKETKIDKVEKVSVNLNESLLIAESTEVNILDSKTEFTNVDMKKESAIIDISESLSVAQSTEFNLHESKNEFSNVEMKTESVAIVEEENATEKIVASKVPVIEPEPTVQIEEVTETVVVKADKKDEKPVHEEFAALKIIKHVDTDVNLSPEIIEIEDISESAFISASISNQIDINKKLEMDVSKKVTETALIGVAKSKSTEESIDMTKISQVSSQIGVSSISNEIISSQKIQSESKLSAEAVQESSFTAKSVDKKLSLRTDLGRQTSVQGPPSTIDTPTPSTVPPTPLTDEYVFKLSIPLPKSRSATPIPRDGTLSPEDEDPHIVKKKLIPHIETKIERVVYDPPLPTPPADKVQSPVYTKPGLNGGAVRIRFPVYRKPGLFGGADVPEYSKEEIREIERKSSLLASAIDETIKSIEEYKEEVGLETKKEVKEYKEVKVNKSHQEFHSEKITTKCKQNGFEEVETKIDEIIKQCNALADIDNETNNVENISNNQKVSIEEVECVPETIEIESKPKEFESQVKEQTVQFENEVKEAKGKTVKFENAQNTTDSVENIAQVAVITSAKIEAKETATTYNEERIENVKTETKEVAEKKSESNAGTCITEKVEEKSDALLGFRPVVFDPESIQKRGTQYMMVQEPTGTQEPRQSPYLTESGELIGTIQGIVDGLEDPVMAEEVAKELGKPGISEQKIAELISGEAEMLREAHVMGLSRVLTSHMHRADDSSVDFQKIKPMIDSLKDSEVLKALNEELARQKAEEKKKEEKRWTTFLQKPERPVPKAKFGYHGWTEDEQIVAEPYKVKIVKQAKPKVAPDYKPEDFDTGPLPWEERAEIESSLPPVEPEEPILIPEVPEFLEAVDPLKESEVPDLEDTGIPLPPPRDPTPPPIIKEQTPEPEPVVQEVPEEEIAEVIEEEGEVREEMDNRLAEQLIRSVQGMVDPNASIDQQLCQMRAQLAALAQLPGVIQQSLELVSKQLNVMSQHEVEMSASHTESHAYQQNEVIQNHNAPEMPSIQEVNENNTEAYNGEVTQNEAKQLTIEEMDDKMETGQQMIQEQPHMNPDGQKMRTTTPVMTEEETRMEKQKKEQAKLDHEGRQVKQHPTPRVGKPKRMFGPLDPDQRPVVLPGGRRWRKTQDVYDEQMIAETLQAQSELLMGKTMGINFMKYEKPPVSLDHLKHSEVYKLVHDMDQPPMRRVDMRTPVISEADYRERCRSMTPSADKKHLQIPQQFHP